MNHTADAELEKSTPIAQPKRGELTAHRAPLPALTGIRFFAAMYVVFFHSHFPETLDQHHWFAAAQLIRNGLLAVPLFFMLSGFILSYTYEGQIAKPTGYRRFWEARFARVWPLYAVSLLLSSIVNHTTPHSIPLAAATILMVQSWNPFDMGMAATWNFVCWTLSAEAFFYLLFPPIQTWLEKRRTATLLAGFGLMVAVAALGKTGGINYADTRGLRYLPLAVIHLPEFLIGVCVGNLFLRNRVRRIASSLPGRGMVTILLAIICVWLLCEPLLGAAAWTALGFPLLLFGLAAERSPLQRLLSSRALIIGGQISFGIYLLQWPCKAAVASLCDLAHISSVAERFVVDCIVLILVSTAGFYGVEEPSRKAIRKLFARREQTTPRPLRSHA
ncbi:acyltransferase family protein [Silvibacterium sp.]|uniref:acyltransferase family protein n=1 Tax=Silvibacterium sp. TaxID=1964179 RepID=UPI0039E60190